jgi:hypothetical protein
MERVEPAIPKYVAAISKAADSRKTARTRLPELAEELFQRRRPFGNRLPPFCAKCFILSWDGGGLR